MKANILAVSRTGTGARVTVVLDIDREDFRILGPGVRTIANNPKIKGLRSMTQAVATRAAELLASPELRAWVRAYSDTILSHTYGRPLVDPAGVAAGLDCFALVRDGDEIRVSPLAWQLIAFPEVT